VFHVLWFSLVFRSRSLPMSGRQRFSGRRLFLAAAASGMFLGNPFINPVSLAIVMSMQSDLVVSG